MTQVSILLPLILAAYLGSHITPTLDIWTYPACRFRTHARLPPPDGAGPWLFLTSAPEKLNHITPPFKSGHRSNRNPS